MALLLIGLPFFILFKKDHKKLGRNKAIWLSSLKSLTLLSILILLYPFQWNKKKNQWVSPTIIILEDRSQSLLDWEKHGDLLKKINDFKKEVSNTFEVKHYFFGTGIVKEDDSLDLSSTSTDLASALNYLFQRYDHSSVKSVIVITDGIYNQGADPYYIDYPSEILPIWVGAGNPTLLKDIMIMPTVYPKKLKLGQTLNLDIQLAAIDYNALKTKVSISTKGSKPYDYPITFTEKKTFANIQHEWTPAEAGWYEVQISTPFLVGETNTFNNQEKLFIEVIEEPFKVLILAPVPHPDIAFFNQLSKFLDPLEMDVHVGSGFPGQLEDYSLIISHQWPTAITLPTHIGHLQIIGEQSTPSSFEGWGLPPLRKLPTSKEMDIHWTEQALHVPDFLKNELSVNSIPPFFYQYQIPNAAIPKGTVLATYQGPSNIFVWMEETGTSPKMLINGVGWWRWHLQDNRLRDLKDIVESPSQPQLLVLNWIKYFQHLLSGDQMEVYTLKPHFYQQETIQVYAQILDEFIKAHEEEVVLELWQQDELLEQFTMHALTPQSWTVDLGQWAEGLYQYKVKMIGHEGIDASGYLEVAPQSLEDLDPIAKWDEMKQWAQLTSSQFYPWNNLNQVVPFLKERQLDRPQSLATQTQQKLIEWSWWYLIILFLLTLDWYLRKKWNGYLNI